jgi:hypothetical protein
MDQHIKTYHAATVLLEWIAAEGLTLERWCYRDPSVHHFIFGIGVEARNAAGEIVHNAVVIR